MLRWNRFVKDKNIGEEKKISNLMKIEIDMLKLLENALDINSFFTSREPCV